MKYIFYYWIYYKIMYFLVKKRIVLDGENSFAERPGPERFWLLVYLGLLLCNCCLIEKGLIIYRVDFMWSAWYLVQLELLWGRF